MKKLISSLALVGVFVAYIFSQKGNLQSSVQNVASSSQTTSKNQQIVAQSSQVIPVVNNSAVSKDDYENYGEDQNEGRNNKIVPMTKIVVPTPTPTPTPTTPPISKVAGGIYKDGSYTGISADAYYGNVQVKVTISSGNITAVDFLNYPQDRGNSIKINNYAMPILKSEVISAQSAQVNIVSGATATSDAFIQSLGSALAMAK